MSKEEAMKKIQEKMEQAKDLLPAQEEKKTVGRKPATKKATTPKETKPKAPRKTKAKKEDTTKKRKIGGELGYEGIERQVYCWIRQRRNFCAIHKSLYYHFSTPILEDKQYDYVEYMLSSVEKRIPDISKAVSVDGWLSPQEYVDCLDDLVVNENAKRIYDKWVIDGKKQLDLPFVTANDTEEVLYQVALEQIKKYPL